jgi:U3 small nucleolar ribonucleoprotein protein IMP4
MTIVTTSRKPVPELRSLAKDFAFAAGCRYVIRGKMGLSDIIDTDPTPIIFSLFKGTSPSLELYMEGNPDILLIITGFRTVVREGPRTGIQVNDPSIYEWLAPYIPVKLSEDGEDSCVFDGTRSRRYLLSLKIHEA